MHLALERALRRAGVPLAYTQGFNPQPRIQLASALPLGCSSEAEIADIWLETETLPDNMMCELTRTLPSGIDILSMTVVQGKEKALQARLCAAEYDAYLGTGLTKTDALERVEHVLSRERIPRIRRGKKYDLRPMIEDLTVEEDLDHGLMLSMRLTARPGATGRPAELLAAMDIPRCELHRTQLHFVDKVD